MRGEITAKFSKKNPSQTEKNLKESHLKRTQKKFPMRPANLKLLQLVCKSER